MSGLEPIIFGGLSVLQTTIAGVSIKDLALPSINVGYILYRFFSKTSLIEKLSKMMITYVNNKYPHKKELKKMTIKISKLFRKFNKKELTQVIKYYKSLKELFYSVQFDDNYWLLKGDKLMVEPELMRDYLVKKIYIQRIYQIILIKLYNNPIPEEDQKELYNDLIDTFMSDRITYKKLERLCENMEKQLRKQYQTQKNRYDTDFYDEKGYLMKIFKESTEGLDRITKTAVLTSIEIINDCKNSQLPINEESTALKRMKSLSRSQLENINEEEIKEIPIIEEIRDIKLISKRNPLPL